MYIYGAGTLGEMVLEVARDSSIDVRGFVDDVNLTGKHCGFPIVGGMSRLLELVREESGVAVFVALGKNDGRASVLRGLQKAGASFPNIVDPRAYVASSVKMGVGNLIMACAYVGSSVRLGDSNLIFPAVSLTQHNKIGDFNSFAPGVRIGGRTVVGDQCKIGPNSVLLHDQVVQDGFICRPLTVVG